MHALRSAECCHGTPLAGATVYQQANVQYSMLDAYVNGRHVQPVACRGCGMLSRLTLDCPALESLDATFCYRLGNEALSWIPQCRPPLQRLFLGLCTQIDAQALHVLSSLGSLRSLDLSYTEIKVPLMPTPHLHPISTPCMSPDARAQQPGLPALPGPVLH